MTTNEFQRRLDERRLQLGLSLSALARRSGLPYSTTRRLLLGPMVQSPKREQLEGLAKGLNWPLEFLQQGALEATHPGVSLYLEESDDKDLQVMIASWRNLSERDRRTILRMAEELRRDADDGR